MCLYTLVFNVGCLLVRGDDDSSFLFVACVTFRTQKPNSIQLCFLSLGALVQQGLWYILGV